MTLLLQSKDTPTSKPLTDVEVTVIFAFLHHHRYQPIELVSVVRLPFGQSSSCGLALEAETPGYHHVLKN